jgi:hypothetical protein
MRRLFLFLTVVLALGALPFSGGVAAAAPSPSACNQGTENAHSKIPHGVPGHEHVPEC